MRNLINRFCDIYLKHYKISAAVATALFIVSFYFAVQLTVNSNQLELLPRDLPQVQEARKIIRMVGGTGFLILTLNYAEPDAGDKLINKARKAKLNGDDKSADEYFKQAQVIYKRDLRKNTKKAEKLKKISDVIHDELKKLKEIRFIQHKFKLGWMRDRVAFRLESKDLKEAIRRVSIKRDELVEKADPFYIELEKRNYRLDLSDIRSKYSRVGKKEITDDYYVSPDRRMMIMLIKPSFSLNEIQMSRDFMKKINGILRQHGIQVHKTELSLVQKAMALVLPADKVDVPTVQKKYDFSDVKAGFTGSYRHYLDAFDSINRSLLPVMVLSLCLIAFILFFFIRKKRLILAMLISLVYALFLTFGLTKITIGELNLITAMMAGIMAGLGIDFGIHFIFRFRESFSRSNDLHGSIKEAIFKTGGAAIWSAATTSLAFIVLISSEMRGFSEFGLIAAYGIFLMGLSMFFLTPLQIIIAQKLKPDFLDYLKQEPISPDEDKETLSHFNLPKIARIVLIVLLVTLIPAIYFSGDVSFDHDSRNMLDNDQLSHLLKEEMNLRYDIAGDPLAVATHTLADTAALSEYFEPMPERFKKRVSQVVNVYGFIPPLDQQLRNHQILKRFDRKNRVIKRSMLKPHQRKFYRDYKRVIASKPYTYATLPFQYKKQFMNVESSKEKGWLTFIYPEVKLLYLAQDLHKLNDLVGRLEFPLLGRRTIRFMAYKLPWWQKKTRRKFRGSRVKKDVLGVKLSEREMRGILDMANKISEKDLKSFGFLPRVNQIILEERPFNKIDDLQKTKGTAITTGTTMLVANFARLVLEDSRFILTGTAALVLIFLLWAYNRILHSILTLIPLVAGLIMMLALMGIFDVKINYFNIVVLPIVFGYGINNCIFLFKRYLESGDVNSSVFRTGWATIASSLTTLAGWGSLVIAAHPGLRSMGYISLIGLSVMMIVAVTVLPSLLEILTEYNKRKAAKVASVDSEPA